MNNYNIDNINTKLIDLFIESGINSKRLHVITELNQLSDEKKLLISQILSSEEILNELKSFNENFISTHQGRKFVLKNINFQNIDEKTLNFLTSNESKLILKNCSNFTFKPFLNLSEKTQENKNIILKNKNVILSEKDTLIVNNNYNLNDLAEVISKANGKIILHFENITFSKDSLNSLSDLLNNLYEKIDFINFIRCINIKDNNLIIKWFDDSEKGINDKLKHFKYKALEFYLGANNAGLIVDFYYKYKDYLDKGISQFDLDSANKSKYFLSCVQYISNLPLKKFFVHPSVIALNNDQLTEKFLICFENIIGQDNVKKRLIKSLISIVRTGENQEEQFFFLGDPGVGKTEICNRLADCLFFISNGELRSENEKIDNLKSCDLTTAEKRTFNGFEYTYNKATPGTCVEKFDESKIALFVLMILEARSIDALEKIMNSNQFKAAVKERSKNFVFFFDEIDKVKKEFLGSLLPLLNSKRVNDKFLANSVDIFCFFVLAGNGLTELAALNDRLLKIHTEGYSKNQKLKMFKNIFNRELKSHNLKLEEREDEFLLIGINNNIIFKTITISKKIVEKIIDLSGSNLGVRDLRKKIKDFCSHILLELYDTNVSKNKYIKIEIENLSNFLSDIFKSNEDSDFSIDQGQNVCFVKDSQGKIITVKINSTFNNSGRDNIQVIVNVSSEQGQESQSFSYDLGSIIDSILSKNQQNGFLYSGKKILTQVVLPVGSNSIKKEEALFLVVPIILSSISILGGIGERNKCNGVYIGKLDLNSKCNSLNLTAGDIKDRLIKASYLKDIKNVYLPSDVIEKIPNIKDLEKELNFKIHFVSNLKDLIKNSFGGVL